MNKIYETTLRKNKKTQTNQPTNKQNISVKGFAFQLEHFLKLIDFIIFLEYFSETNFRYFKADML